MTIIAGIVSRTDRPPAESSCARLAQLISRNPVDEVRVFKDDRSYFAKTDIKAFGEPGFFTDANGVISFLAGEPLLANSKTSGFDRHQDLVEIHEQCLKGNWDVLREANGRFWRWDEIETAKDSETSHLNTVYDHFQKAVRAESEMTV